MKCPRCGRGLVAGRAGELVAHGCPRCAGVWLDRNGLTDVVGGLSDEALAAMRAHSKTPTTEVNESIGDLACPVCARVLERKLVEFALVELDVCDAHGCWFDRGEVECISAAIVATPESEPQAPPREMVTVDGEGGSPYIQGFRGLLREMHRIQLDSTRRAARILAERKRPRFNRS